VRLRTLLARILCTLGVALPTAGTLAAEQPRMWNFRTFLDDKPIGYHRFTLTRQDDLHELKSEARFEIKILLLRAYRYVHDAAETWEGECLIGMKASTNDNGKRSTVNAKSSFQDLVVTTAKDRELLPGCIMSFAYWNPKILTQSRLLNAQTGQFEAVNIALLGEEVIRVRDKAVTARRYRITGPKNPIDLWYAADGEWLALESIVDRKYRLRYTLY